MTRLTPLFEHVWHLGCGYNARIETADHNVVGSSIGDLHFLVPGYALIKLDELVSQLTNSTGCQLMQVSLCPSCVFTTDAHLTAET